MVSDFYQKLHQLNNINLKKSKRSIRISEFLRLSFFIGFVAFLILFLSNGGVIIYPLILSLLCLICFITLITYSRKFKQENDYFKRFDYVVHRELKKINKDFQIKNSTNYHINDDHPFAFDLDIIGDNSLFSRLNRTSSEISEKLLINSVTNLSYDLDGILKRQNAIEELSTNNNLNVEFNTIALSYFDKESEVGLIDQALKNVSEKVNPFFVASAVMLSLCTIAALVLAVGQQIPHLYWMILFAINLIGTYWVKLKKADKILSLDNSISIIRKYHELSEHLSTINFEDQYLKNLSSNCQKESIILAKLMTVLNFQKSSNFITNGFFLLDIYLIKLIANIKSQYKIDFGNLVLNFSQIEELVSIAFFKFNNPSYTFPLFTEKPRVLNFKKMGHPFLNIDNCVTNDFSEDGKNIILTGSNMSGKSTFLRGIGINFVLAHIGAPVFASRFETSIGKLFTAIKTVDSLKEQKSFFYSELLRLSDIQKNIKEDYWALVLLDEALKGTNSEDKLSGSISLATKFSQLNCTLFFATHDTEMVVLEKQNKNIFSIYHFESKVFDHELIYDYKLRKGVTSNKNASFLLKKLGVID